jgi:FkbH-like protein
MLSWLPPPKDFQARLRAAAQILDPAQRLDHLSRLAHYRLGLLETIQLDRALGDLKVETSLAFSSVKVAILASSTVGHLVPGIRVAGLRRGLLLDVYVGGYGQYRQELLDAASTLHRFGPQVVLFSLSVREAISGIQLTATAEAVEKVTENCIEELRLLWKKAREVFQATVIQQTFLDVTDSIFGSFDRCVPASPPQLVRRLNDQLADNAASDSVLLLDIARSSEREGRDVWFDRARWFQAKQEIAPKVVPVYGELLSRVIAAQRGLSKKCLVLDLDNTLWHGVVGDDGVEGIILGEGTAVGEAHLAFQHYVRQLLNRGVILAVCSKNDPKTAEDVFKSHPDMVLKMSDFAAFVANWNDKAENLKTIAAKLNIGLDSLVFVDDNPVERSRIRQALPVVAVPELPDDVADYVHCLADAGYFESVSFTSEDQQRGAQYAANTAREALLGATGSIDDFLRNLEMSVDCRPFVPVDLARVTQLINKTNQFHPTTRRYTAEQISRLASTPDCLTLQFRLMDRFGDNGLVSAMILRPAAEQPDVLMIDTWVMSCRVFGRQLEVEAMNVAVEEAKQRGIREIVGEYIPTAKNSVVRGLFEELGFASVPERTNGSTKWSLTLSEYVPRETHIIRKTG